VSAGKGKYKNNLTGKEYDGILNYVIETSQDETSLGRNFKECIIGLIVLNPLNGFIEIFEKHVMHCEFNHLCILAA